jgi:hypothetical protein
MIVTLSEQKFYVIVDTHKEAEFTGLDSSRPFNVLMYGINRAGTGPLLLCNRLQRSKNKYKFLVC